jgi:uncharacterized delta-60 repeat protein
MLRASAQGVRGRFVWVVGLATVVALGIVGVAFAAAGDLDPSFSGNGKVVTSVSGGDIGNAVAIDSQNRIVVAGDTQSGGKVSVVRYLPDGRLDPSFSHDGKRLLTFGNGSAAARAVAIDSRNRVIVAGSDTVRVGARTPSSFGVARLTARGKFDPSFSGDGRVVTHVGGDVSHDVANSVAIDSAGRIVATGSSRMGGGGTDFTLVRYRPSGTLDPSFSGDGVVRTAFGPNSEDSATSVAIDSAGRIVAAGGARTPGADGQVAVARYLPGGNLDPGFSGDGRQVLSFGNELVGVAAVAIDDQNRIVLAGGDYVFQNPSHIAVIRLRPNGALDKSFASDGKASALTGGWANSVAIDPAGRIVAGGYAQTSRRYAFGLARFTPSGALDPSFSGDGTVTTSFGKGHAWANGVAIDSHGRIVAAGWAGNTKRAFAVARYLGH